MKKLRILQATLFVLLVVSTASCSSGSGYRKTERAGNNPTGGSEKTKGSLCIESILLDSASYTGEEVVVEGIFLGWKGKCNDSAPLTRSDWILEDPTGCIYVTGLIPDNLDPAKPSNERVLVRGFVETGRSGKPLIKAVDVRTGAAPPK